ncbi:hypothetical protein K2173_003565 [Erythroxylum novogranatense]|uniref:Uncharacterized protein n=1 Tax=Erythroxylum novogranatense TaxID=1862640 RepID=A0AAV8TAP3_9ROSI|nr:hypothetical protein K2173_003565 [Erythroxylum novogranatense]
MEEYLQCMKTLRSQINEVEDQSAKITAEEQTLMTRIQAMSSDLSSAKSETNRVKEDTHRMIKEKGSLCSEILDKQRKIASLEFDSSTLAQSQVLIQQERLILSSKLVEKRAYYLQTIDDINSKLLQQQDWVISNIINKGIEEHGLVKDKFDLQTTQTKGKPAVDWLVRDIPGNDARKELVAKLDSSEAKLHEITLMKSKLLIENDKPDLAMDFGTLEDGYKAFLSDKGGEF